MKLINTMKTEIFKTPFFSNTTDEVTNYLENEGAHDTVISLVVVWDTMTENWIATLTLNAIRP